MILLEFPNNFQLQSKLKQNSHVLFYNLYSNFDKLPSFFPLLLQIFSCKLQNYLIYIYRISTQVYEK
uniref:Uncharacterized protein n=1 Tax=Meloidogyne enterolobii TaxID=390850 RepID=A0A6V7VVM5_MELEN|nr:unnamed protein product [Meloidogyne enterolobii]